MAYVALTIDTSIFDRYQCRLESGILAELAQFNGMPTGVVLSEIVIREVKAHIQKRIDAAKKSATDALKDCSAQLLIEGHQIDQIKANLMLDQDSAAVAVSRLEGFIKRVGAEVVPVEGNVELKRVLSSYFSATAPFSEKGQKKSEFPDAFALMSLETWAEQHGGKILAVSMDKDWVTFADSSNHLDCVDDLGAALATFQPSNDALKYCSKLSEVLLNKDDDPMRHSVEEAVSDAAYQLRLWPEADAPFHAEGEYVELDISAVSLVENTEIVPLQVQEHRLTVQARFLVESVATCDFDFAVYDSIDKDYVNMGGVQADREFDFEVSALIELSGDFSGEAEDVEVERAEIISGPASIQFGYIEPHWMNEPDV